MTDLKAVSQIFKSKMKWNIVVALFALALTTMEGTVVNGGQEEQRQMRRPPMILGAGINKEVRSETPQGTVVNSR